jgi:hypothetical protein
MQIMDADAADGSPMRDANSTLVTAAAGAPCAMSQQKKASSPPSKGKSLHIALRITRQQAQTRSIFPAAPGHLE